MTAARIEPNQPELTKEKRKRGGAGSISMRLPRKPHPAQGGKKKKRQKAIVNGDLLSGKRRKKRRWRQDWKQERRDLCFFRKTSGEKSLGTFRKERKKKRKGRGVIFMKSRSGRGKRPDSLSMSEKE